MLKRYSVAVRLPARQTPDLCLPTRARHTPHHTVRSWRKGLGLQAYDEGTWAVASPHVSQAHPSIQPLHAPEAGAQWLVGQTRHHRLAGEEVALKMEPANAMSRSLIDQGRPLAQDCRLTITFTPSTDHFHVNLAAR